VLPAPVQAVRVPFPWGWSPGVTAEQVPCSPATSHAWHWPVQGLSQQKVSTQLPEAHWVLPGVHVAPFGAGPHDELTQAWPATQSLLTLHVVAQAVPEHRKGLHGVAAPTLQVPAPSQTPGGVAVLLVVLHEPIWQTVPLAHCSHLPVPSHLPSCLQVEASEAVHAG